MNELRCEYPMPSESEYDAAIDRAYQSGAKTRDEIVIGAAELLMGPHYWSRKAHMIEVIKTRSLPL